MLKQKRLVITFNTPDEAFALEAACKKASINGRLMPAPVALTGGCGIGWTCAVKQRSQLEDFIRQNDLKIRLITEIVF